MLKKLIFLLPISLLIACSTQDDTVEEAPLEELYIKAHNFYKTKSYKKSIRYFQAIERLYPYSDWTIKAQTMMGYIHFLMKSYPNSIETFKLFVDLYPNHPDIPYALYMIGRGYYEQLSIIERDQSYAFDAIEYFETLLRRFPDSKYARDAQSKIKDLRNHLAGKLNHIGRFYQNIHSYSAAINRYLDVVEQYSDTDHTPEALLRLYESYKKLNQTEHANHFKQKLLQTYPESIWAKKVC